MSEHMFFVHDGHLSKKADQIAEQCGAWHTNYTDERGKKRGWFSCINRGNPFDRAMEEEVRAALDAAGGIEKLTLKR